MSILSLINTVLQKQGWLIARLPSAEEERAARLAELLVEDTADGRALRDARTPPALPGLGARGAPGRAPRGVNAM